MTDYNIDFKDHVVQFPNRFKQVQVSPGVVDLVPTWIENPSEVIEKGTPVNADLFDKLRANVTRRSETFAATAGQTVFNLTKAYLVDQGRIDVYISGIKQRSGVDFTETSPTSFTLSDGLDAGTIVEAVYFSASQALSEDLIEQVQAAEAATIAANEATANAIDATEGALTANLNWKEPVSNLAALNALSNPQIRDTRQTRDTGDVYRYDGTAWVLIQTMDPNAITALDTRLTAQLAEKVKKEDFYVSVEDFGAEGDGVTDDTTAIQTAINTLSAQVVDSNLTIPPRVLSFNGRYKVTSKITLSPFVKLKAIGQVVFDCYVANDSVFHLDHTQPEVSWSLSGYLKQQYYNSPFINGVDGGFLMLNRLTANQVGTTALEIGARVRRSTGQPTARYSAYGLAIQNFEKGIKFNPFDNYLGHFDNCHLELNTTLVEFGDAGQSVQNSGENITFKSCVLANADTGFKWNCDEFSVNLIATSCDYIHTLFYVPSGGKSFRNIYVSGGHIEAISQRAIAQRGGIVVMETSQTQSMQVTFSGVPMLLQGKQMFYSSVKDNLVVELQGVQFRCQQRDMRDEKNGYLAHPNVILKEVSLEYQEQRILTSKNRNHVYNGDFKLEAVRDFGNTGTIATGDLPKGFASITGTNIGYRKIVDVADGNEQGWTKAMELYSTSTSAFTTFETDYLPLSVREVGKLVHANAAIKQADISNTPNLFYQFRIRFYDKYNTMIDESTLFADMAGKQAGRWNVASTGRIHRVPIGAASMKIITTVSGFYNVPVFITGIHAEIV